MRSCRQSSTAVERRLWQGGSEGKSGELGRNVRGRRAGMDGSESGERAHPKSRQQTSEAPLELTFFTSRLSADSRYLWHTGRLKSGLHERKNYWSVHTQHAQSMGFGHAFPRKKGTFPRAVRLCHARTVHGAHKRGEGSGHESGAGAAGRVGFIGSGARSGKRLSAGARARAGGFASISDLSALKIVKLGAHHREKTDFSGREWPRAFSHSEVNEKTRRVSPPLYVR